jgi:hypothetical protein
MNRFAPLFVASVLLAAPVLAQDVTEPKSGAKFAAKENGLSLLGVGLRTKTIAHVKVYAVGLYVADSALSGPLKAYKGKTGSPEFARAIVDGDFRKRVVLKFQRDLSEDQMKDGFRDALKGAGAKTDVWVSYFSPVKAGSEMDVAWTPGTGLETKVAGLNKSPINDKAFAASVFGIWLGDKPIQDDIKRGLVANAESVLP